MDRVGQLSSNSLSLVNADVFFIFIFFSGSIKAKASNISEDSLDALLELYAQLASDSNAMITNSSLLLVLAMCVISLLHTSSFIL